MTQPNTTAPAPESAAAPTIPVSPADPIKVRSRKPLLWAATAGCALVVVVLALQARKPQVPEKLPDPVASSQVVTVPGKAVSPGMPAATAPSATISQAPPIVADPPPSAIPTVATPPNTDDAARNQPQATTPDSSKEILDALQRNAEAIASVEQGIDGLKAQLVKLAQAPKRAAKVSGGGTAARPALARAGNESDSAQLLSIDLWGGKPSVVVGRNRGDGTEVTFLNEGEKQGRVTVKRADVGSQRAVMGTDRGDVVLSREE